ncbi:MAG: trimethylamine methyltransferase family protein [Lentisphaeria bacterium]|jgi:trimethylamine--corrinoid protein Co-methyltransferase|nr:trimethylamine methyltransferase family protein [Lentisphaeria bacterium]
MPTLRHEQIAEIDRTSRRILSEIGVRVDDDRLRQLALSAGAGQGSTNDRLLLPPEMVDEYLALAPPTARFADCRGGVRESGTGSRPTFWTGAALNWIEDNRVRSIVSKDLADMARLADALPNVSAVVGTSIEDVPPPARDFVGFRILAENCGKHLRPLLFTAAGVEPILEMAQVIADGRTLAEHPLVSFGYSCLSPLHWSQISVELWRRSSGHKLPLMLNAEPIAGATSPVTLAGSVALSNAEILAGVVLVQLLEPARPVIHNLGFAHTIDMRSAACLSGAPECGLMAHAGAQMAAHYGLPSAAWMCTDALIDDGQAALEKTMIGLVQVLAGTNVIWGVGQLETQKALSPVQAVIDDARADMLLRIWDGLCVDDENLAYEAIRDVATGGGDFLAHDHTLRHFREALSESPLMARTQRETWEAAGSKHLNQGAAERAEQILAQPPVRHLSDQQSQELRAIEQRALQRC